MKKLTPKAIYFQITRMKSNETHKDFMKKWKEAYPKESPFKK